MGTHPIFESDFDCLTEVMSGVHNLCKLDYPIYCCSPFESKSVMVGGGGGALGPKTGVRNAVELLELDQRRNEVIANPTMSLGLGKACAWNMDTHRSRQLVAFGRDGECRVYHIKFSPIWKWKNVANDEIQCIDWSPDSKWLCSAFRDGTAFLHDAQN